jgi:hypothetical protein
MRQLFSVVHNIETGEELAFFAPEEIHVIIVERGLGKGSEFTIKKVAHQNGKKTGSRLELSFVSAAPVASTPQAHADNLKEIMRQ